MPSLYDYIFGPSIYRIFDENRSRDYVPFTLERYSDLVIRLVALTKSVASLASPYIVFYFYRNFIWPPNDAAAGERTLLREILRSTSFKLAATMMMAYALSSTIRGVLRCRNPAYRDFIQTFKSATALSLYHLRKKDDDASRAAIEARDKLRHSYDYDFNEWPVDFKWSEGAQRRVPTLLPVRDSGGQPQLDGPVVRGVSWLMAHTIGRIMLYPGSLRLLQKVLDNALVTGRQFLIENYHASRYKLEARDGNHIDCIFADRRNKDRGTDFKGNTLVICSEGNAGFYEIGIFSSPLNQNYSVLGWNHPGFGGSTGSPYPQNEINAFDTVINFAVSNLGFELKNIHIFAWSIGGFPAAWASSNYPELKGVILDASFDDVLPLARARMMPFLLPIVDSTIRYHFNLNVSAYLNLYKGPVLLYRRLQDEIIPLNPSDPIRTNRGNFILIKLLKARFPVLMQNYDVQQQLERFLHTGNADVLLRSINNDECLGELLSYITTNRLTEYPINIDPDEIGLERAKCIILFLASKMMKNINSTHCTPLPPAMFEEPFDLFALAK